MSFFATAAPFDDRRVMTATRRDWTVMTELAAQGRRWTACEAIAEEFRGTINVDICDSAPDREPLEPPRAAPSAPSVVYVLLDDVGSRGLGCHGGLIETPNIDRLAADGEAAVAMMRASSRPG